MSYGYGGYPQYPQGQSPQGGYRNTSGGGITIFSALMNQPTTGTIAEMVFCCLSLGAAVLGLIAAVVGRGLFAPWLLLCLFGFGLCALLVFRLREIAMLYGCGFFGILIYAVLFSVMRGGRYSEWLDLSPLNFILFLLVLLLACTVTAIAFAQFFARKDLMKILTILVLVIFIAEIVVQILLFAVPSTGDNALYLNNVDLRESYNRYGAYWVGIIGLWLADIVTALLFLMTWMGYWGNSNVKIIKAMGHSRIPRQPVTVGTGANPQIQGLAGAFTGQMIPLHGRTVTIGSDPTMVLMVPDGMVSRQHCAVRFQPGNGIYEVYDNSKNGTYLANGVRLQKGVWTPVRRGTVICIGHQGQQFRLI